MDPGGFLPELWLERSDEPLCGALSKVQYPHRGRDGKENALSRGVVNASNLLNPGGMQAVKQCPSGESDGG